MKIQSQHAAEQRVYQRLVRHYPEVRDPSIATLQIGTEPTIALETGWVIAWDITYADPNDVLIGNRHYFVDRRTGALKIFAHRPDFRVQEAVYQAVHDDQTALPWPMLVAATVDGRYHFRVNVFPSLTICGRPVENPDLRAISTVDWRNRHTCCFACGGYLQIMGHWCDPCGRLLLRNEAHVCPVPEPDFPPLAPEDNFWRD
jgi:hypothetical protein